jgi:hypothetical protein
VCYNNSYLEYTLYVGLVYSLTSFQISIFTIIENKGLQIARAVVSAFCYTRTNRRLMLYNCSAVLVD